MCLAKPDHLWSFMVIHIHSLLFESIDDSADKISRSPRFIPDLNDELQYELMNDE